MKRLVTTLVAGTVLAIPAIEATASTLPATGTTTIEMSLPLNELGVNVSGVSSGRATVDAVSPMISLGITSDGPVLIEHTGDGITLSTKKKSVTLKNLVIDTENSVVSAKLGKNSITLFKFDGDVTEGVELLLSKRLDRAIKNRFGDALAEMMDDYAASKPLVFGSIVSTLAVEDGDDSTVGGEGGDSLSSVPLPAGLPLALTALGLGGLLGFRRKA